MLKFFRKIRFGLMEKGKSGRYLKYAISLMKKQEIGCLPVVNNEQLVGIITIKDVIPFDNDQSVQ